MLSWNGTLLVVLVIALILLVAACASEPMPPPFSRAAVACQPEDSGQPAPYPEMAVVAGAEDDAAGAALLAAPVPGDPSLAYLAMCAYTINDQGETHVTDRALIAVDAVFAGTVAIETRLAIDGDRPRAGIGGRVSGKVARLEVTLSDGSRSDVPIRDGHFLCWWRGGAVDATSLVAYDTAGVKIGEISDGTGLVRHGLPRD